MPTFRLKEGKHWNSEMGFQNPNVMNLDRELMKWLFNMEVKWYLQGRDIVISDKESACLFKLAWV